MKKKYIRLIILLIILFVFYIIFRNIYKTFLFLKYYEILNTLKLIPLYKILIISSISILYYILLSIYDIVAFRYIKPKILLRLRDIILTCFISNIFGNNVGFSILLNGAIKYRMYSIYNISMSDTTKILFFSYLTMWLGLITIMSFIFMIYPFSFKKIISYNLSSIWFSILFIVVVILYFFLCIVYTKPIKVFKKYDMKLPNIKIAVLQILVSVFDWLIASLALYIALPIKSYSIFLRAFLLSHLIGIMSQVPGGIGIFETTMSILLSINIRLNNNFMAGLIIYRLLFYLLPLLLAIILFIISEIFLRKKI